jgi:hypothetical protein
VTGSSDPNQWSAPEEEPRVSQLVVTVPPPQALAAEPPQTLAAEPPRSHRGRAAVMLVGFLAAAF